MGKNMLGLAISIASEAFEKKTDKAGKPYILHCLYVMQQMPQNDEELCSIAVLHDLVEDTDWSIDELKSLGFSTRVTDAVRLLTHEKHTSYDDYIKAIATNADAKRVKLADLKHNSDITRIKGLRKKDFDRLEKYHRSFVYLSE